MPGITRSRTAVTGAQLTPQQAQQEILAHLIAHLSSSLPERQRATGRRLPPRGLLLSDADSSVVSRRCRCTSRRALVSEDNRCFSKPVTSGKDGGITTSR